MRGTDVLQEALFTTVHLDRYVPADHPLRPLFDEALHKLLNAGEMVI